MPDETKKQNNAIVSVNVDGKAAEKLIDNASGGIGGLFKRVWI